MMPSISPGSWPLSFSACWTFFTSALLAERLVEDISEEDDPEDEDIPVSLDWLVDVPDLPVALRLLPVADPPLVPLCPCVSP